MRGWRRFGGAILILAFLAGCSLGPPASDPAAAQPSATPAAAATGLLAAALAPIRPAAEYESTVTVDGTAVLTSTGRTFADASIQTVTSQGRTVEYVHVPPGAWARDSGGAWVQITADQAPGSPLDALAAPTSVERVGGSETSLTATYAATALGLAGDPVTVTIEIDGSTVTFRYATTVGEKPASSVTILRPSTSSEPIVPPAP